MTLADRIVCLLVDVVFHTIHDDRNLVEVLH